MDFSYSEEQQMLQDSVGKFISQDYEWESRQAIAKSDQGFSAEHWLISLALDPGFGETDNR